MINYRGELTQADVDGATGECADAGHHHASIQAAPQLVADQRIVVAERQEGERTVRPLLPKPNNVGGRRVVIVVEGAAVAHLPKDSLDLNIGGGGGGSGVEVTAPMMMRCR